MSKILWRTISDLFTRAEVYLEPSQTSKMELLCEYSSWLKVINYFRKKTQSYMFNWVSNTPLKSFINDANFELFTSPV